MKPRSGHSCNTKNIAFTPFTLTSYLAAVPGLGLGDILRPELILPLIEEIPLEGQLASYLPEVKNWLMLSQTTRITVLMLS